MVKDFSWSSSPHFRYSSNSYRCLSLILVTSLPVRFMKSRSLCLHSYPRNGIARCARRFTALFAVWCLACTAQAADIGEIPDDWTNLIWVHGEPQTLEQLRGRVVLIRWWTAPGCPFCKASSAALNEWHQMYEPDGLTVIGFYHHKSSAPLSHDQVSEYARTFGFRFPIAIDDGWSTLKEWWLTGNNRAFTSVSFLLDRNGVIRYIHPGGDYVKGDEDYRGMNRMILQLLDEPATD